MSHKSTALLGLVAILLVSAHAHAKQERYHAETKEFAAVQAAIFHHAGKQGGVRDFMKKMATQGFVKTDKGKVTYAQFKDVWKDKTDSDWVEGKFRDADDGKHERIPSNYIPKVIERARTTREGEKWIDLQDKMRSSTRLIVFHPSKWEVVEKGGKQVMIPQGHTGALSDKHTGYPLTAHQADFHDELRKVFDESKTIPSVVDGVKKVVTKWVWNGEPVKHPIASEVLDHDKKPFGPNTRARATQRQSYDEIMDMLTSMAKTLEAMGAAS